MDRIDLHILEILQENAAATVAEIAAQVGLSPTPCWKRIQKLEATGVLQKRVAILSPQKVGIGLSVLIAIQAGDHSVELRSFRARRRRHAGGDGVQPHGRRGRLFPARRDA